MKLPMAANARAKRANLLTGTASREFEMGPEPK